MISSEQPDDRNICGDAASLQALEDLLAAAVRMADAIGLPFPAIRIEEALMLVRAQSAPVAVHWADEPVGSLH